MGNRLLKNEGGALTTYSYDAANQLQTSDDSAGTTNYTFDANGNQTRLVKPGSLTTTYTWDYEDQPTKTEDHTGVIQTALYAADKLRVRKTTPEGTTMFLWDGSTYLAETDVANLIVAVYTNESRLFGNVISQYREANNTWLASYYSVDGIGSTRQLTGSTEDGTDTRSYTAFGESLAASGVTVFPFDFLGQYGYLHDEEVDSYYDRRRVYLPALGRWLDAINNDYGLSLNSYQFVPDNTRTHAFQVQPAFNNKDFCLIWLECRPVLVIGKHCGIGMLHWGTDPKTGKQRWIYRSIHALGPSSPGHGCELYQSLDQPLYTNISVSQIMIWPAEKCKCVRQAGFNFNTRGLLNLANYAYWPENACQPDPRECNSNYATKCVLRTCGIKVSPPWFTVGWDHRIKECVDRRFEFVVDTLRCCCRQWKTIDSAWCDTSVPVDPPLIEPYPPGTPWFR